MTSREHHINLLKDVCHLKENAVIDTTDYCSYDIWSLPKHLTKNISAETLLRIMTVIQTATRRIRIERALLIGEWCLTSDALYNWTTEKTVLLRHEDKEKEEDFYYRVLRRIKPRIGREFTMCRNRGRPRRILSDNLCDFIRYLKPIEHGYMTVSPKVQSVYLATIKKECINDITAETLMRIYRTLHSLELKGLIKYGYLIIDKYLIYKNEVHDLTNQGELVTYEKLFFYDKCDEILRIIKEENACLTKTNY